MTLTFLLTVYDPFFLDIPVDEDTSEMSSEEEAQLNDEASTEKEVELPDVLHNVIVEPMNATFKEVLLENVVMKDQITSLNTQVEGLEAKDSSFNFTVT